MANRHIVTNMELHSMERIIKEGLLGDIYLKLLDTERH